jgi:hypothetical protein
MKPAKQLYGAAALSRTNASSESDDVRMMRQWMWAGLGMTPEGLGERLRVALDKAVALLEATETRFFSHKGKVTDERVVAALKEQIKAVHEITNIVQTLLPKHERPAPGPVNVNVVVPWTSGLDVK